MIVAIVAGVTSALFLAAAPAQAAAGNGGLAVLDLGLCLLFAGMAGSAYLRRRR